MPDLREHREAGDRAGRSDRPSRTMPQLICRYRRLNALGDRERVLDRNDLGRRSPDNAQHLSLRLRPVLGLVDEDPTQPRDRVVIEAAVGDQEAGAVLQRLTVRLPWRLRMESELKCIA